MKLAIESHRYNNIEKITLFHYLVKMITNLKDSPELLDEALHLIEESFEYQAPQRFEVDFYPLVSPSNREHNHLLLNEKKEVVAHIGCKVRSITLGNDHFNIVMLGGIAVSKDHRGSGLFQKLFSHVINSYKEKTTFFLLWSDLEKLYTKFSFSLCGGQFEFSSADKDEQTFTKTKYSSLSEEDKTSLKNLYSHSFKALYLTPDRNEKSWEEIERISSADLFIRKNEGKISDYFFMNKGQDLSGIIYEYGTSGNTENFLKEISTYGKLWTAENLLESTEAHYQFFLSIGNEELFKNFISLYTEGKFAIRAFNFEKNEIFIDYENETLSFEIDDFLRGVFGPEKFEEIETKPIFISGIDSI